MPGVTELLKMINYTYIGLAVVFILIICALYFSLARNQSNSSVQTNAPLDQVKKNESFASEQKSKDKKGEIVLYYAMWCGYSRSFLPEWEKFEVYAKENLPQIKVTRMKCEDENTETCTQRGIKGFPMIVFYPVGKPEKIFDKDRFMQKLVEFVNENI